MNLHTCLTLVLFTVLVSEPAALAEDLGFRYNAKKSQCLNKAGKTGTNPQKEFKMGSGSLTECSDLSKVNFLKDAEYFAGDIRVEIVIYRNMNGSIFTGQDLSKFNFLNTQLNGADLSNTDLRGAKFRTEELKGIKLTGAKFDEDTILPKGWTKESALKMGMVFVSKTPPEAKDPAVADSAAVKDVPPATPNADENKPRQDDPGKIRVK